MKYKPDLQHQHQPENLFAPLTPADAAGRLGRRLARLDSLIEDLERRGLGRQVLIAREYRRQLERDGVEPRRSRA